MDPLYAVRENAREAALARYGLAKTAGVADYLAWPFRRHVVTGNPQSLGEKVLHYGKHVGEFAREIALGSPVDHWHNFQAMRDSHGGALPAYAKLLKDWHWTPKGPDGSTPWFGRALNTAFTGLDAYNALTSDPDQRAGNVAALGASLLAGPVIGSFGMVGGTLGNIALTSAVRGAVNHLAGKPPPPTGAPPPDFNHPARYVGNSARLLDRANAGGGSGGDAA